MLASINAVGKQNTIVISYSKLAIITYQYCFNITIASLVSSMDLENLLGIFIIVKSKHLLTTQVDNGMLNKELELSNNYKKYQVALGTTLENIILKQC